MIDNGSNNHVFVVCAYGASPYLEECIVSLQQQTVLSKIILVTSTPNQHINDLVKKYNIPYFVNDGETGIAEDWNYGYLKGKKIAEFVTIAHQDDIYLPQYTESVINNAMSNKNTLIYFCDYAELRNGKIVKNNKLLIIKRIMLFPLRIKIFQSIKWIRRRILSFGSPICCPSVTYCSSNLPETVFTAGFKSDVDWEAWEKISKLKGKFVFNNQICMYHRIHKESTTTELLNNNERWIEDYTMFKKFWPERIAKFLVKQYTASESSNDIQD